MYEQIHSLKGIIFLTVKRGKNYQTIEVTKSLNAAFGRKNCLSESEMEHKANKKNPR